MEILNRLENFLQPYMDAETAGIVALIIVAGAAVGIFWELSNFQPVGNDCRRIAFIDPGGRELQISGNQLGGYNCLFRLRHCLYFGSFSQVTQRYSSGNTVF